jgi:MFS family permease
MLIKNNNSESNYRWYILILAALTNTLVVAIQGMCLPVLFKEISTELNLDLVQVGMIWGINALPGIFTMLLGGAAADRFGPRRILIASCLLAGLAGALRGLSTGFASLAATMFLFGLATPFISMNNIKTCGMWFSNRQLGLANGALSMGMALGFLTGSMFSATVLSPWLGGWRNVLFLYGILAMLLSIPWYFSRSAPVQVRPTGSPMRRGSLRQNIAYVSRIRNIWLLGLAILGFSGCVQGALGYLPLYLRDLGWPAANADGASAAFHTISMIFVIPIALLSDRLGTRKKVLIAAGIMMTLGVSLLPFVMDGAVWVTICLAGMVRDGFMAVFLTSIVETEGVGADYAGTATGMVLVFSGIGNLIAPPLGNSLAYLSSGAPFLLWAAFCLIGITGLLAAREKQSIPILAVD